MALAGIKEGRQSRYKTTCLLIILILFSVFRQFGKLKVYGLLFSPIVPSKTLIVIT